MTLKEIVEKYPELEKDLQIIAEDFFEDGTSYQQGDIPAIIGESIGGNEKPNFFECWEMRKEH